MIKPKKKDSNRKRKFLKSPKLSTREYKVNDKDRKKKPCLHIFNAFLNDQSVRSRIKNINYQWNRDSIISSGNINSRGKETVQFKTPESNSYLIEVRAVVLKVGEIDTLKEKFYAEAFIEAVWVDSNHSSDVKYDPETDWNPKLYVMNCLGDLTEQIWHNQYSINEYESEGRKISNSFDVQNTNVTESKFQAKENIAFEGSENKNSLNKGSVIVERRRIKGQFWQTLNLKNFPFDVQDLTITLSTPKQNTEVELIPCKLKESSVNTQCFANFQEWQLYRHTNVREFLRDSVFSKETFPTIDFTINAARRPTFYCWNAFLLIFLITLSSLSTFSVDYNLNQHRLQTTCTLLLTSVTFKWITNRSLPTVSYMTSLDKYSIACMLFLCLSLMWHAICGVLKKTFDKDKLATGIIDIYDHYAFIFLSSLFAMIQFVYLFWLVKVGYKKRRRLDNQEKDFTNSINGYRSTRLKSMLYGM